MPSTKAVTEAVRRWRAGRDSPDAESPNKTYSHKRYDAELLADVVSNLRTKTNVLWLAECLGIELGQ